MPWLRVALCQIDAVVGDLEGNAERILAALSEAEAARCDVAVLPELALCGYPPEDLLFEPDFVAASERALSDLAALVGDCAVVTGCVVSDDGLRNGAAVCWRGKRRGISYKQVLPNYGVFDEKRWFVPGTVDSPLYRVGEATFGVVVCEDLWRPGPVDHLAERGAGVVLAVNASPYRLGALEERRLTLAERAASSKVPIAYVNLVGGQDELVFDGGSMVVGADGTVFASAVQFGRAVVPVDIPLARCDEAASIIELGPSRHGEVPEPPPHVAPLAAPAEVYSALVLATRDYVEKNGFHDVAIGLSGGIDSSLVAAVAVDALGPSRVHGVAMPSRFSSQGSLDDAAAVASALGVELRVISIEGAQSAFLELLAPSFAGLSEGVAEENLQARERGTLLMALSNKLGWLVLTTGNKSEIAVGYSTLYGDTAGGFAVLRDVPKLLVYELARHRNAAGPVVIPDSVLDKAPSAELRPGQRDDDALPPYDELDPILEAYVERHASFADVVAEGRDPEIVRRVFDLVDLAEYKRRQEPPGPRVTSRGFGKDRRMPITNRFRAASAATPPPVK